MAYATLKDRTGAKKGKGAWCRKKEAKKAGNKARRGRDRSEVAAG